MRTDLVFLDSRVPDYRQLAEAWSGTADVFILDAATDGLAQILARLQGRGSIDALHIVSHGSAGSVVLGNTVLDATALASRAAQLAGIGSALSDSGDILLYGCSVAEGEAGIRFLGSWAEATGADVAASTNLTGAIERGGDWQLEASAGTIEAQALVPTAGYATSLSSITGTDGGDSLIGTVDDDVLSAYAGSDFLDGKGGNDLLDGGADRDWLHGGVGDDTLIGGDGDDDLQGDAGNDTLQGGAGNDTVSGGAGSDTADGGDGDDRFGVHGYSGDVDQATGGLGRDTFSLSSSGPSGYATYVVTDFAAGDGGDLIDVDTVLNYSTGYVGGNPFAPAQGYLRLLQSGADTLLQWDQDGVAATGQTFRTVLTLSAIDASALTASNFVNAIPPDGSSVTPAPIVGTAGGEGLVGGYFDDTIYGLAGVDSLSGHGGNDLLDGGADRDSLRGGVGDDTLIGGDGNDDLQGDAGNDVLDGGTGNDILGGGAGSDTADGGDGDDLFGVHGYSGDVDQATGGLGRDTYSLSSSGPSGYATTIVTDFAAGQGGDFIDVDTVLDYSTGYVGGNPFASAQGYLRLLQSGADTLLQWDQDGAAGTAQTFRTVLTLANIDASTLTASNFVNAIPPDGSTVTPAPIVGTANGDGLAGGYFDDTIYGLAGSDSLSGHGGNDLLDGGVDRDWLNGGVGDDTLIGGDGNDDLQGDAGNDVLDGGSGNDILGGGAGSDTADGGDGDDLFGVHGYSGDVDQATGGLGRDTYSLSSSGPSGYATTIVTDFAAGEGGDFIDVDTVLNYSTGYVGGNPMKPALGYLRLQQSGADTLLQWDQDGAAGTPQGWTTVLTLQGVSAAGINAHNFKPLTIEGTAGDDVLTGGLGVDTLTGGAGNDELDGDWGDDTMDGGEGDDTYHVDHLGDLVREVAGQGSDKVIAVIDYVMAGNVEHLDIGPGASKGTGNALDNVIQANDAGNEVHGGGGNDHLKGGKGRDKLTGGDGDDTVDGGEGDDEIVGGDGAGNDTYVGGDGIDTVRYTSAVTGITVNLQAGTASGNEIGSDTLSGIENIIGGQAGDSLTGDDGANGIDGYSGDDSITGGGGADVLTGGDGSDVFRITAASDSHAAGFDTLTDLQWDDRVEWVGIAGVTLASGAHAYAGSVTATVQAIQGDAGIVDQVIFFSDGADGYLFVKGAGSGTSHDGSLVKLAGQLAAPSSDRLPGVDAAPAVNDPATGEVTITGLAIEGHTLLATHTLADADGMGTVTYQWRADGVDIAGASGHSFTLGEAQVGASISVQARYTDAAGHDEAMSSPTTASVVDPGTSPVDDTLTGGEGDDVLIGLAGKDTLVGLIGNDTLDGGADADNLDGGDGDDLLLGGDGNDLLVGGIGNDRLYGGEGDDNLADDRSAESSLYGEGGNDILTAGGAGATLDGGDGDDQLFVDLPRIALGGAGNDVVTVSGWFYPGSVTIESIDGGAGQDELRLTGYPGPDDVALDFAKVTGFETLTISTNASWGDVTLDDRNADSGSTLTVRLLGMYSGSSLNVDGSAETDAVIDMTGGASANRMTGGQLGDTLRGGASNDVIDGQAGNDDIVGGEGNDRITGGAGNDLIDAGNGTDTAVFSGHAAEYTLTSVLPTASARGYLQVSGPDGTDLLYGVNRLQFADQLMDVAVPGLELQGTAADEALTGGEGDDVLIGLAGKDTLVGLIGNDTLDGGADADSLDGGDGDDLLLGGDGNDLLVGGIGNDRLYGGEGDDNLADDRSAASSLYGEGGNDILTAGGAGATLDGGDGDDQLFVDLPRIALGGAGNDVVTVSGWFYPGSVTIESIDGGAGNDELRLTGYPGPDDVALDFSKVTGFETLTISTNASWGDVTLDDRNADSGSTLTVRLLGMYSGSSLNVDGSAETDAVIDMTGGASANRMTGGQLGDTLRGGASNDVIDGQAGNDDIVGGEGNDRITGGAGNDLIDAGNGTDTAVFSGNAAEYTLTVSVGQLTVLGPDGTDLLRNVNRLDFADQTVDLVTPPVFLVGDAGDNRMEGDDGDDYIDGGAGDDEIIAGGGNDELDGGEGADDLSGGTGDDTYHVDHLGDLVREVAGQGADTVVATIDHALGGHVENLKIGAGAVHGTRGTGNALDNLVQANDSGNELHGGGGNDRLRGGQGADKLTGGDGDDVVDGGDGDDEIVGGDGAGDDSYIGGAGIDTVRYTSAVTGILVNLQQGMALGNEIGRDTLSGIENVIGGQAGDWLGGDDGDNDIDGYTGDDRLSGGRGADHLDGGSGTDSADHAGAEAGVAAYLTWEAGNQGEAAGDTYTSIEGLIGSAHADILSGSAVENTLIGNAGNDWLFGREGQDALYGGAGNDVLSGGSGSTVNNHGGDLLDGGDGIDVAYYRDAPNTVFLVSEVGNKQGMVDGHSYGISIDIADGVNNFGEAVGDVLVNIENIWGSRFDDVIRGDDHVGGQVYGFEGNDVLDGRGGDDVFYGGTGADTLTGGAGAEDFFYLSYNDHYNPYGTLEAYEGGDTITDFEHGVDHITVSRYWFGFGNIGGPAAALTDQHADFITDVSAAATTQPTFFWNATTGVLEFDPDGSGATAAVNIATLSNQPTFTLSDIWTA